MTTEKTSTFQGLVQTIQDARTTLSGIVNAHQIWIPRTKEDVATAVARTKDHVTFLRSGLQDAADEVIDVAGAAVIQLAALNRVALQDGKLDVEPGAVARNVASQLAKHDLVVPLFENPERSFVSNAIDDTPTVLVRSLGRLSDYVSQFTGVTHDGKTTTRKGGAELLAALADKVVITELKLEPKPAGDLWLERKSFVYPGKAAFLKFLETLFVGDAIPTHCDLVVEASNSRLDIPIVRVLAAGKSSATRTFATVRLEKAIATLPAEIRQTIRAGESETAGRVLQAIVDGGASLPTDRRIATTRLQSSARPDEDPRTYLDEVAKTIDRSLAPSGPRSERTRLDVRLQLDDADRLTLTGVQFVARRPTLSLDDRLATPSLAPRMATPFHVPSLLEFGRDVRIPGFQGAVYGPTDLFYDVHAHQYATTSYKREDMTPFLIAFPSSENDVRVALKFAEEHAKSVVARSGGHQYSGTSSGGQGTIVLAMDHFDHLRRVSDKVFDVGPAVQLADMASQFEEVGVTIPHGECPFVCIGGHAQTGGFGHLLRSFGLALDYVIEFTIVLADGSVKTVKRPPGAPTTNDDELFWGVLGGNAGSFGIVINYRIECVRDEDHPGSSGYSAARWYRAERFKKLMKQVQAWTRGVVDGTLPPDFDFMMTVASRSDTLRPPIPTLLVELVHSDSATPATSEKVAKWFDPVKLAADDGAAPWEILLTDEGPRPLSELSNSFVRRFPFTTPDGREFRHPYRKRVNCTSESLTDPFVEQFVKLIDKVVSDTDGVYLIFQMLIGGGRLRSSVRRTGTSIPRRDFVYCFVFDLFFAEDAREVAEQLQQEMQQLIDAHFSSTGEQRLFWGSFGDTDMSKNEVRKLYYDDPAVYARLQQLKERVDPNDLIRSRFTVKLP